MKINDLPPRIKALAELRIDKDDENSKYYLITAFAWKKTKEGFDFWHKIYKSNFQPFYYLYGTDDNPTEETAIKSTPIIQLPYGCEFIGKEMEVSDSEDFRKFKNGFVVFYDCRTDYSYCVIGNDRSEYYTFARDIGSKKIEIQSEIKTLEDKIKELKKELK